MLLVTFATSIVINPFNKIGYGVVISLIFDIYYQYGFVKKNL
jgi:hypothetical protein